MDLLVRVGGGVSNLSGEKAYIYVLSFIEAEGI